ncbi:GDYXXLXY domain-containing protein [Coraliomargarita sp. W4R72]
MKTIWIWLGASLALGLLNLAIWQKEATLANGETVYLRLAPVDPRSLMQGDYMVLDYAIAREVRDTKMPTLGGRLVLELDAKGVAHFARLDDDSELATNERYLAYKNRYGAKFGIESFFFQEGKADKYEQAEFAKIRLSQNGSVMLIDLVKSPQ